MKKYIISFALLLCLAGCGEDQQLEILYEGQPLHIAVIGETPDIQNESITFEPITMDAFNNKATTISEEYDAVLVTPNMFLAASLDLYSQAYHEAELPIIFWNSSKAHYPFVNTKINYLNETDVSLNNSTNPHSFEIEDLHSVIFLSDSKLDQEKVWYFNLDGANDVKKLYTEIFHKINEVSL